VVVRKLASPSSSLQKRREEEVPTNKGSKAMMQQGSKATNGGLEGTST